jgi:hypothetical protein
MNGYMVVTGYCHNCGQHYANLTKDLYDERIRHECKENK